MNVKSTENPLLLSNIITEGIPHQTHGPTHTLRREGWGLQKGEGHSKYTSYASNTLNPSSDGPWTVLPLDFGLRCSSSMEWSSYTYSEVQIMLLLWDLVRMRSPLYRCPWSFSLHLTHLFSKYQTVLSGLLLWHISHYLIVMSIS